MRRTDVYNRITSITMLSIILGVLSFYIPKIGLLSPLSIYMWVSIQFVVTLAWLSNSISNRGMFFAFLYFFVIGSMRLVGHLHGSAEGWIVSQVIPLMLALMLFFVYTSPRFTPYYGKIIVAVLVFLGFSLVLNVIGLIRHPDAVAYIAGGGGSLAMTTYFQRIGVSGYGFYSGLPPLIPVLVYYYKYGISFKLRLVALWLMIGTIVAVVLGTITAPLMLVSFGLIFSLAGEAVMNKGYALSLAALAIAAMLVFSPEVIATSFLDGLIYVSPSDRVALRLNDIKMTVRGDFYVTVDSDTSGSSMETRFQ
jgi:hypothetical protein